MSKAVQTIWLEHVNISSVLACLRYLSDEIAAGRWQPDFQLLSDILDYMAEFPDQMHHPKEEQYLLKALRARRPESEGMLEKVHEEHVEGARMLAELRTKLHAYEDDPQGNAEAFVQAAHAYVAFERRHMALEERELLPLAMRSLKREDWQSIDAAFADNEDPLFGTERRAQFERLFQHILDLAPGPMGFGAEPGAR